MTPATGPSIAIQLIQLIHPDTLALDGTSETDDNLGKAVATGDFDGDGQVDVAVSAPYESPGSDPQAGVVFLYKGTLQGLVPWRWISQETTGLAAAGTPTSGLGTNAAGDQYGLVAVGDFDGDGVDDLAVGAPGKDVGSVLDAGAVYLYRGFCAVSSGTDARHGLQPWKLVTQATLGLSSNENFDRFASSPPPTAIRAGTPRSGSAATCAHAWPG